MGGKIIGAAAGAAVLLLLGFIVIAGGGTVATANASTGGCAVTVPTTQPGASGPGTTSGSQKSANVNAHQMAAARTIVAVGKGQRIAERGIAIALGTAMQESTLDPAATNGRSVGLFQQQGELYANVNRTDPADASRAFYEQLVARVPNYADPAAGTFADIAQTVQASAAGAIKYAPWENWAVALAKELISGTPAQGGKTGGLGINCRVGGGGGPIQVNVHGLIVDAPAESGLHGSWTFPNDKAALAGASALSYLGTPYAWGGGDENGPTKGKRDGGVADKHEDFNKIGFDCSGLTGYAWAQAGVNVPRTAQEQQRFGNNLWLWLGAKPGDLLFYGSPAHHVALYLGKLGGTDYMVEAPQSGDVVKVSFVRQIIDFQNTVVRPY